MSGFPGGGSGGSAGAGTVVTGGGGSPNDDTLRVQAALNAVSAATAPNSNGKVTLVGTFFFGLNQSIVIPSNVCCAGTGDWPMFFMPPAGVGTQVFIPSSTTNPVFVAAAGTAYFCLENIAVTTQSGTTTAPVFQANGTSGGGNGVSAFRIVNVFGANTGGFVFNYANRCELKNVCLQPWFGTFAYDFENCTIVELHTVSCAAGGTGTGPAAQWAAGFRFNASGSINAWTVATTGAPWYGFWGTTLISSKFQIPETNGAAQDCYHFDGGGGDNHWWRIYNNGACINCVVFATSLVNAQAWRFNNGSFGNWSGSAVVLAPTAGNTGDILFHGCDFENTNPSVAATVTMSGPLQQCRFINNKFAYNGAGPIFLADNSTATSSHQFIANTSAQAGSIQLNNAASSWWIRDNSGLNPRGSVGPPTVPGTGVAFKNPYGTDARVLVTGGTVTNIGLDGVNTGLTTGWFMVPANGTITLTYTGAPTWAWWLI